MDIYLNHQVVRQGEFLSLYEEVSRPQRFGKNLILSAGVPRYCPPLSCCSALPLELPFNLSMICICFYSIWLLFYLLEQSRAVTAT
ncbi:MAG: IgaA/UmoB family intracellular growth attenuator [Symbiopectobacterium sp.]